MNKIPMTTGAPWKHIVRFALPVLLGSLLQQLYNTADAIVVGNFSGEASLSAVGTTGSFTFLFLAIAMGFSAGNGVIVAQHYGARDMAKVRENASTGILFLMILGVGFSGLGSRRWGSPWRGLRFPIWSACRRATSTSRCNTSASTPSG